LIALAEFICDPYSREIDSDPFPIYKRLRDDYPCYWSESGDCWMLTRYDDVTMAARDWETFSSRHGNMLDDIPARTGVTLGTSDPPRHDQMRALIQFAFGRQQNEYLVEPTRKLANEAIDKFIDSGQVEFIADFTSPLTVGVLSHLLGIPQGQHEVLRKHVVQILQTNPETRKKSDESMASFQWLADYTGELLEERRKTPSDDLLTHLLQAEIDGDSLQEREIQMTSLTLIMPGVESA
jgi:cytochrome P450